MFQGKSNGEQRAVVWLSFHSHWESRVWMSGFSFEPARLMRIHLPEYMNNLVKPKVGIFKMSKQRFKLLFQT